MAGILHIAKKAQTTPEIVKAVTEAITEFCKDEAVIIKGFGTFKTKTRAAKIGRNPITGTSIQIPAKEVITFKAH